MLHGIIPFVVKGNNSILVILFGEFPDTFCSGRVEFNFLYSKLWQQSLSL